MIIGISQPTFIPWYGYFGLIEYVDEFIFLDHVQFDRRSWQQRNYIKIKNEKKLLTIPTIKENRDNQKILDVKIDHNSNFTSKFIKTIQHSYNKSKFYNDYSKKIFDIFLKKEKNLLKLNVELINYFCEILNIKTKMSFSSNLNIFTKKQELIKDICKLKRCTKYVSTAGAKNYLNIDEFMKAGIELKFFHLNDFKYSQLGTKFIPKLSIMDLVFNEGPKSSEYIKANFSFEK